MSDTPIAASSGGSLVLPMDEEHFKDFISGLLGKPQTISAYLTGGFSVDHADIRNVFHLVDQRIRQQNNGQLVQFTVKVDYNDGSSVLVNSLPAFESHTEVRPIVSVAVHLSWTYLIRFHDKVAPEKQQIDVSMGAMTTIMDVPIGAQGPFVIRDTVGHILIQISHTARTWGVDMESLLVGHFKTMLTTEPRLVRFLTRNSGWVGLGSGLLFFVLAFYFGYLSTNRLVARQLLAAQADLQALGTEPAGVAQRIEYLIRGLIEGRWRPFSVMLPLQAAFFAVLAVIFGVIVGEKCEYRPASFVLLTRKAREAKETYDKRLRRRWFEFAMTFVFGVISSIVASIVFEYLFLPR